MDIRMARATALQIPEEDPRAFAAIELCVQQGKHPWNRVESPSGFSGYVWQHAIYEALLLLVITGAFEEA